MDAFLDLNHLATGILPGERRAVWHGEIHGLGDVTEWLLHLPPTDQVEVTNRSGPTQQVVGISQGTVITIFLPFLL